jgi:L-alanine-DL-glutamate epimerase-like enolase superfamily enzyme
VRVATLEAIPFTAPLHAPFGIATGAQAAATNVLVRATLDDGTVGLGEAAPFAAVNGETQASAAAAVNAVKVIVEGSDPRALRPLAHALRGAIPHAASARCAVQTAVLDALCRRAGLPMWAYFGGGSGALVTDYTITTGTSSEAAVAAAAIAEKGFATIKLKVGGASLDADRDRIAQIARAAPGLALILDGNCGVRSPDDALGILHAAERSGCKVVLFEQPLEKDDHAGQRALVERSPVPIAADESVGSLADVVAIARDRRAHAVNLKCMKSGLVEAYDMAVAAKACGLALMIGAMVESELGLSASACLAAGAGGFSFVDLDTHMFFTKSPATAGFAQDGPVLRVAAISAGHGARFAA